MNAESKDISQRLASQLSSLNDQLDGTAEDVQMLASIREGIAGLLKASGGNEAGIRRVLQEQYDAGELREETFQLVRSMLDRFVSEEIATAPDASSLRKSLDDVPETRDDAFASTTVISDDALPERPQAERAQVGSVLRDRFMLQKRVAGGSMGVVYRALDRRLAESGAAEQWVAIKVLSAALARNGNALRALQQEAAKGRNLAHPNIVRFIDFDRDDDLYFLVMEWLDGRTLAEVLDTPGTKKLDIDEALEIVRQVGKALEYAHRCGIVHADVKPGNVMVLKDGTAKLFDFGVARVWQKTEAAKGGDFDPGVLGAMTPAYSSMQVITGEMPAPSDDVFSLACLLYRLIAGYRVFGPRNAAEACEEGMKPQPLPGLSSQQWEAVRKALSFSRVTRFATVAEFLDALNATSIEKIAAEPRGNVHSEEPSDIGKWLVGLAAASIVGGFAAYELGYLDQWLTPGDDAPSTTIIVEPEPVPAPEPDVPDVAPVEAAANEQAETDTMPAETGLPVEAVVDSQPESIEPADDTVAEPVVDESPAPSVPDSPPVAVPAAADTPAAPVADGPAAVEVPLDRSGLEQAISVRLREEGGRVAVDLLRLGRLDSRLAVRLEEVDYSGNRSPLRTGQYSISGNGIAEFVPGDERARVELVMASDPLREADQQSTLKIRAVEGDSSGLAYLTVELEDDDQRAFETGLPANTVGFAVSQMSVGEQDPAVQVDIVRYNPDGSPLTVGYRVSSITAADGEDYFSPGSSTITFAPGQRSARLLIPLVQDAVYEGDEAFVVELLPGSSSAPEGVYQRIAIMIRDDDLPRGN